jgi:hypothetical protein
MLRERDERLPSRRRIRNAVRIDAPLPQDRRKHLAGGSPRVRHHAMIGDLAMVLDSVTSRRAILIASMDYRASLLME